MHGQLDRCWAELHRVLAPGGLACINIGDATRSLDKRFALWPNHARILQAALALGFTVLPDILWRKPNNSPTKFMGSGMLPAGAYVTYEHEYVLILRKGDKRRFDEAGKRNRRASALFWEERNAWYCDLWDLTGTRQSMPGVEARKRSAAFPFELAWRLIQMHSVYGDVVLDPFAGTGTTALAAAVAGRSSVLVEHEPSLLPAISETLALAPTLPRPQRRLEEHRRFASGRLCKHENPRFGPVVTSQERELRLWRCHEVAEGLARYTEIEGFEPS
jgi:DNA modification methylase